ncbi:hypothetical protein Barb4_00322 [Bacteroidales bacterium Barb4]|nr:hypothetical protein Barb4_00322 [Bacteroidales bacterium Barb4]
MKKSFMKSILLLSMVALLYGCEEKYTSLPPETQSGANTFGCLVNGKLFVDENPTSRDYAAYGSRDGYNYLLSISINANGPEMIQIVDSIVETGASHPLRYASFEHTTYEKATFFSTENSGEIYLTRFDTINKVVSGIFSFRAEKSNPLSWRGDYTSDTVVNVTQGRFDLEFNKDIY